MWTIKLDELSSCMQDPIFSAEFTRGVLDSSAATDVLPVADGGDVLLLSDRANYVAIDLAKGRIRWRRPIDNNDRFDPPLRFSVCGPYVTVLKRDYTSPAFYVLDAQSGEIKWMKKDQGALFSACLDAGAREIYGIVAPDLKKRGWTLACLDAETGAEKRRLLRSDWEVFPETQILGMDAAGRLAVRILTGKSKPGELWLVDGKGMKGLHALAVEGAAEFGIAGGKSCVCQDGYEAVLWPGKMRLCRRQE
jgi:outer membrane protein assembly factor BamB